MRSWCTWSASGVAVIIKQNKSQVPVHWSSKKLPQFTQAWFNVTIHTPLTGAAEWTLVARRVLKVFIRDCAGSPNNRSLRWPRLSAIHLTAKAICQGSRTTWIFIFSPCPRRPHPHRWPCSRFLISLSFLVPVWPHRKWNLLETLCSHLSNLCNNYCVPCLPDSEWECTNVTTWGAMFLQVGSQTVLSQRLELDSSRMQAR